MRFHTKRKLHGEILNFQNRPSGRSFCCDPVLNKKFLKLFVIFLFFSASSAVCVEFFVKSHLMSNDSNALNHAVNECTGAAEIINGKSCKT